MNEDRRVAAELHQLRLKRRMSTSKQEQAWLDFQIELLSGFATA